MVLNVGKNKSRRKKVIHKKIRSRKKDISIHTLMIMIILVLVVSILSMGMYLYAFYSTHDMVQPVNVPDSVLEGKGAASGMATITIIKDPHAPRNNTKTEEK